MRKLLLLLALAACGPTGGSGSLVPPPAGSYAPSGFTIHVTNVGQGTLDVTIVEASFSVGNGNRNVWQLAPAPVPLAPGQGADFVSPFVPDEVFVRADNQVGETKVFGKDYVTDPVDFEVK